MFTNINGSAMNCQLNETKDIGNMAIAVEYYANKVEIVCEKGNYEFHIEITPDNFTWKVIHGNHVDILNGQLLIIKLR